MNRSQWIITVLVLLITGLVGYRLYLSYNTQHSTMVLYGDVDIRELDLAFRQSGRLEQMRVDEGDSVKAGTLVATLDAVPLQEALNIAKANLAVAQANAQKMVHGNRPQEIAEAQAAVAQAKADAANAHINAQRQQQLLSSNSTPHSEADTANTIRQMADARLVSAQQGLNLAQAGFRQEDIDAAKAQLAVAQAQYAAAETALSDTRLFAPADAVVLSRVREPGSIISPQTPVYTLSVLNPVYIRAYVSESQLGKILLGTTVKIYSDSMHKLYRGTVGFISPRAEFTPKSVETTELRTDLVYRIRIRIDHPDAALHQGMPVTVQF